MRNDSQDNQCLVKVQNRHLFEYKAEILPHEPIFLVKFVFSGEKF